MAFSVARRRFVQYVFWLVSLDLALKTCFANTASLLWNVWCAWHFKCEYDIEIGPLASHGIQVVSGEYRRLVLTLDKLVCESIW